MATQQGTDRNRTLVLSACALLAAVGAALIVWAFTHQTGEPPRPDESLSVTEVDRGGSPSDDAAATSDPTAPSPDPEPTPQGQATEAPSDEAPSEPATEEPTAEPTPQALPTEEAPTSDVEPLPASEPVTVAIPAIDVTSPLHPLGLRPDGTLEVPSGDRFDEAAWYDGSVTPGEAGVSVIEGHVTSARAVPSIFFNLGDLQPGDLVEVDREDGTTATFEVYALDTFPKDGFPTGRVFGNSATPELRLITCGGVFDEAANAHVDNIVVFASYVG